MDHDLRAKIESFVRSYKQDDHVTVGFEGWLDRAAALDRLAAAFKPREKRRAKT